MLSSHCTRAALILLVAAVVVAATPAFAQQPPALSAAPSTLTILIRAVPVGTEQVAVERRADGWTISASGRIGAPVDLITRSLNIRYDPEWRPRELAVDATARGQETVIRTIVEGGSAKNTITVSGKPAAKVDTIDPSALLLLPGSFFAPYEAIAAQLRTAAPGTTIPAYVAAQVSIGLTVGESTLETIQTLGRTINARRTRVTLVQPGAPPFDAEIWGDETGRLLRLSVPAQNLEVVREDVGSVSARRVAVSRQSDEPVRIPATGFSLAGTISRPPDAGGKPLPAIVLVGGSGPTDRDETIFGIPIFGQLGGALADAGFIVLRYDKRAVGQSGGRAETATLADFADDLRAAVRFMSDRKDVDRRRLAVVGHSEGGPVSMLTAAKEKRIGALVLMASLGMTGAELNMAQVTHGLQRSTRSDADKQATIDLQKKIQTAVLTGKGWEEVPEPLRRQADIPWFQSFLAFDPARVMRDIDQPLLIVQPMLDTQVPPVNADQLESSARARKKGTVEVVRLPGLNHLLVPATTGEVDEYGVLKERNISPSVATAIVSWLQKTFAAVR